MTNERNPNNLLNRCCASPNVKWFILSGVTLLFTVLLYPNLVSTQFAYQVGDVAERDIKAPKDFLIEDLEATEVKRKEAVAAVLTVYDHDEALATKIAERVTQAFETARQAYAQSESPVAVQPAVRTVVPPVVPPVAGSDTGSAAEAVSVTEAAAPVLRAEIPPTAEPAKPMNAAAESGTTPAVPPPAGSGIPLEAGQAPKPPVHRATPQEIKAALEKALGIPISEGGFSILEKEGFSRSISEPMAIILQNILTNGVVSNKELLLKEADKGITLREISTKTERVEQKLDKFYGLDQSKIMARVIGQPYLKDYNYVLRHLIVDFAQRLIQPNITLNRNETEERKKRAGEEIKPILYKIKAGEMLLREGERVTEVQLLKLQALQRQIKQEQVFTSSIGVAVIVLCLLLITFTLNIKHQSKEILAHNKNLLFIACTLTIFLIVAKVASALAPSLGQSPAFSLSFSAIHYGIPIAAGSMIICVLLGIDMAVPFAGVLAVCTAIILQKRLEFFIYFFLSGAMAAYWVQDCRERKVFIKAGLKLGCLNIILTGAIDIYVEDLVGYQLLWDFAFAFLGGIGSGIITAGIIPLVELAFNYTTDIKLLELANLDQPILRRLMIEASGTYHHSVVVGSMVEAAASEIGANPLLAKVCGYYHDIGKINKPLYFIENQGNGKNKHDNLAPSMSKRILIAHVKDGVEIARKNKLGAPIIDTIRQSHGTSIITYFYEKAKQINGDKTVNPEEYRYPGPKPQTKEAGLVLLADISEAASRTLSNPTPARIQGLVQKLINNVFSDGQLDNCELTLKDLHNIANSFNKILNAIHHHRIEYSEITAVKNGVEKNGSPHRQPAAASKDKSEESGKDRPGHLKRLGMS